MRPLARQSPAKLLTLSMLGGALLLLAADILVRGIPGTQELQLGVLTSASGGPFFLYLVLRHRRSSVT
jgi:iron complex transport system permease protein